MGSNKRATACPARVRKPLDHSGAETSPRKATSLPALCLVAAVSGSALGGCSLTADLDSLTAGPGTATTDDETTTRVTGETSRAPGDPSTASYSAPECPDGSCTSDVGPEADSSSDDGASSPLATSTRSSTSTRPSPSATTTGDGGFAATSLESADSSDPADPPLPDSETTGDVAGDDATSSPRPADSSTSPDAGCAEVDGCGCADACDDAVLVHRYRFTDIASGVIDAAGDADGTLQSQGEQGAGTLVLNGDNYVRLPPEVVSGLTSVTFETWFVSYETRPWERIFDFGESVNGSGKSYLFFTAQTPSVDGTMQVAFRPRGGSERTVKTTRAVVAGELTHVAVVFDGIAEQMSVYADGQLAGSAPSNAGLNDIRVQQFWLGRSMFSSDPRFRGELDEFRIYDGALSAARILRHFIAGPDETTP